MLLLGENWSKFSIRHFQKHWAIEVSMGAFKVTMGVYISYKFGGLLSGTSVVNVAQLCTASIKQQ